MRNRFRWLVLALIVLIAVLCPGAEIPKPHFVPTPKFVPIPKFTIPTVTGPTEGPCAVLPLAPRADEIKPQGELSAERLAPLSKARGAQAADVSSLPASPPAVSSLRILRWERQCGPNGCVMVPVYEESVDQAAAKLQDWRGLPVEEAQRLAAIVNAPAVEKARKGHWSPGTCLMLDCPQHPSHWVADAEESQAETDAKTVPWSQRGQTRREARQEARAARKGG